MGAAYRAEPPPSEPALLATQLCVVDTDLAPAWLQPGYCPTGQKFTDADME
jgi:hypothetical protein